MDATIAWLLEGPEWLKYATTTQLLDTEGDADAALHDSSIQKLLARLKDSRQGLAALATGAVSSDVQGSAVWDLFFLADIGFKAVHLGIEREIKTILDSQLQDGSFITEAGMESNYYCKSAILLASLARLGYADAPPLVRYLERLLSEQRPNDGWHCEDCYREACPMDNLNILMLLSQYEAYRKDRRFNGALNLLLEHWQKRDSGYRLSDFGIGRRYRRLQYPAIKYGILRVLDVISLFPYGTAQPAFQDMLSFVRSKARDGRYFAEMPSRAYQDFDFDQTVVPSRWIAFLVKRIEMRYGKPLKSEAV